jgi:hypothetical protein
MAVFGLAISSVPVYLVLSSSELPTLHEAFSALMHIAITLLALTLATLAAFKDLLHIELHKGSLLCQWGLLPDPSLDSTSMDPVNRAMIRVLPTPDRGNGAFATATILKGSWIGDYEGEQLSPQEFDNRYPKGGPPASFATRLDDDCYIDAVALVGNVKEFAMVHMNHSKRRANVDRIKLPGRQRVVFTANRDIQPGEELLYDYGRAYWRGREREELD